MNPQMTERLLSIPCEVNMTIQFPDALLDVHEAAERTRLSTSTLAKLRLSGNGPTYIKLGRRVGYRLQDIDAWIELNRVKSTSEYPGKAR